MEASKTLGYKVYFCADTHLGHKNIIQHCPDRASIGGFEPEDLDAHDEWVIDIWNKTVNKKDIVYICGDFTFLPAERAQKVLQRMRGRKFLILGNHDKSVDHLVNYFEQIIQMKEVVFKKDHWDFLDEDFRCFLCHYPMVTWPSKHYGTVNIHGHCHGRLDNFNEEQPDLRLDVGWDSTIGNHNLVDLETVYRHFKEKTNGQSFHCYARDLKQSREMIV